ncbi:hypothetical protein KC367_g127 [Hortaea werneckii]|nr:hypothetical protein KC367_g127 [Hortaea werneckii]
MILPNHHPEFGGRTIILNISLTGTAKAYVPKLKLLLSGTHANRRLLASVVLLAPELLPAPGVVGGLPMFSPAGFCCNSATYPVPNGTVSAFLVVAHVVEASGWMRRWKAVPDVLQGRTCKELALGSTWKRAYLYYCLKLPCASRCRRRRARNDASGEVWRSLFGNRRSVGAFVAGRPRKADLLCSLYLELKWKEGKGNLVRGMVEMLPQFASHTVPNTYRNRLLTIATLEADTIFITALMPLFWHPWRLTGLSQTMQSRPPSAGLPQSQPIVRLLSLPAGPPSSRLNGGREPKISSEALFCPFARPGVVISVALSSAPLLDARLGIRGTREPVVNLNRIGHLRCLQVANSRQDLAKSAFQVVYSDLVKGLAYVRAVGNGGHIAEEVASPPSEVRTVPGRASVLAPGTPLITLWSASSPSSVPWRVQLPWTPPPTHLCAFSRLLSETPFADDVSSRLGPAFGDLVNLPFAPLCLSGGEACIALSSISVSPSPSIPTFSESPSPFNAPCFPFASNALSQTASTRLTQFLRANLTIASRSSMVEDGCSASICRLNASWKAASALERPSCLNACLWLWIKRSSYDSSSLSLNVSPL